MNDFIKILEVKRYSSNTINSYVSFLKLVEHHFNTSLDKVTEKQLFDYVYHLIHIKNYAYSSQKQLISAIKLYYKEVLNKTVNLRFILPERKPKKLPEILSREEARRLLHNTVNNKA